MRLLIFVLLASLLFVFANAQQQPADFVLGPFGSSVGHNPYPGYTLITIDDLQSHSFLSSYNAVGLSLAQPFAKPASGFCPFIALAGSSFAAVGSPLDITPTLLAPFTPSDTLASHSTDFTASPMWIGTLNAANEGNNTFIGPFSDSFVANFYAISAENLNNNGNVFCSDFSNSAVAIYKKAQFFIAPYGANYPSPTTWVKGATFATLADVRSETFASPYNLQSGLPTYGASSVPSVCCAVRVAEGYLTTVGQSSIAPYNEQSSIECPSSTLPSKVQLGTANDGSYPLQPFPNLNYSILQSFTAPTTPPSVCTGSNVWALYKASSLPSPNPPPSPTGNCYDMQVQVSYYLPDGTICLAIVYRAYMEINKTYSNMIMSGLNECAGSVGQVSAFNVEIQPYSDTHLIGRTTGATSCNCQAGGVNLWGLIPLNETGHSEMTTICSLPIQEFYFCNVLMFINKGPVQCP